MGRHKKRGKREFESLTINAEIEIELKEEEKNQPISWIFWLKVVFAFLLAGSAIGGGIYWVFNKPVIVTHFISLRDEHNSECFDLLTANGNLLDDDDSDDICIWREHQYNITYTLYVWIFMIISFGVIVLFYFNFKGFKNWRGHKHHIRELEDDNGERLYYLKLCYEPWIWWTTAAMLGRFEVWDLTHTALMAVIYCLTAASIESENARSRSLVDEKTDKKAYIISKLTSYVSLKAPIINFLIFVYWVTYLFVHYFEIFSSHIHHNDKYVTATFIIVAVAFIIENVGQITYYILRKALRNSDNSLNEILKWRYRWECFHWFHQILYVMIFIWTNAGLLWNIKYIY